ncbi:glycoside hydrolase family 13 protein [Ligilactobacillus sp. WILCCON 0076]|uniref:Glycoside hydrolase family 13 protein n=1 Tax=Ligilactobacillus ubinensis TaxID=2876789 RepID=A0A9X2FNU1_9LACO|nr:glycoside hydrolase family 13 protein [Ligilactobacillus ubinensis]MCP0887586.1 glycoside hydrolase family 13 protein [Ligilactobacillus ubinensis]
MELQKNNDMELAAIYHHPNSEMAYALNQKEFTIILHLKHNDAAHVELLYGDPYSRKLNEHNEVIWQYETKEMTRDIRGVISDYWQVTIPITKSRHLEYVFRIFDKENEQLLYDARKIVLFTEEAFREVQGFRTPYLDTKEVASLPSWVKQTIWYQIMPDRFANGNPANDKPGTLAWNSEEPSATNFFGGDLQGIIDHLDYLQDMGINGLDLTPIFTAYSNHKYDSADFWNVDPSFGDKEVLKKLVNTAHNRGMHVMLEGTFDHISDFCLQWQDVRKSGSKSHFANWFKIQKFPVRYTLSADPNYAPDANYEMFANDPHLPKLNLHSIDVQDYICKVLTYWIQLLDIDAWKISTADEFPSEFRNYLHEKIRQIKPDFYLVGENKDTNLNLMEDTLFNGSVNYPLSNTIKDYFLNKKTTVGSLIETVNTQMLRYCKQKNQGMLLTLDTPQTPRILSECKDDKKLMRAMIAYLFMQTGSPVLLYGTELGLKGENIPANRACMQWNVKEQDKTMLRFLQILIEFRKKYSDLLNDGRYEWGQYSSKYDYFSFTRSLGGKRIFALFNLGYSSIKFVLPQKAKLILSQNMVTGEDRLGQYGFVIIEA